MPRQSGQPAPVGHKRLTGDLWSLQRGGGCGIFFVHTMSHVASCVTHGPLCNLYYKRNVMIRRIVASWRTPFSADVWQQIHDRGMSLEEGLWHLGPALSEAGEPRLAEVVVANHGDDEGESDGLIWSLLVRDAPSGEPPDEILERNERLGGRQGLTQLMLKGFPRGIPQVASFDIKLRLDAQQYSCSVLPIELRRGGGHEPALGLASKARLEQVGYRFEDGASGIKETSLVFLHDKNAFSVAILANGHLKLNSATWLPYADEVADLVLSTFFVQEEPST